MASFKTNTSNVSQGRMWNSAVLLCLKVSKMIPSWIKCPKFSRKWITLAALGSLVSQRLISFRWDWSLWCYEVNLLEVEFSGSKIIRKKGCLLKIHSLKNGPTFHLLTFIWFSFYSYFDWCFHPRKDCYTYLYPITLLFYFSRGS